MAQWYWNQLWSKAALGLNLRFTITNWVTLEQITSTQLHYLKPGGKNSDSQRRHQQSA